MATESQVQQPGGKLVALEGDVETIATQLRLLPPSQKILVLSSLQETLPQDTEAQSFDARAFIRRVHNTFADRTESARLFLRLSTDAQPRLVFMNGGSVSARTTCITRICENITNGDVGEAEVIFNEIVKDGVAGLMKSDIAGEKEASIIENIPADMAQQELAESDEDPTVKAMKAADSLDRETAELQDDPLKDSAVNFGNDTGKEDFDDETDIAPEASPNTIATSNGDDIVRTVVTMTKSDPQAPAHTSTFGPTEQATETRTSADFPATAVFTTALTHQGEKDGYDYDCDDDNDQDLASPGDEFVSAPPTPGVVYGEARVVDVATVSPKRTARRVRSSEVLPPIKPNFDDWGSRPTTQLRHTKSAYNLGRPGTAGGRTNLEDITPILPISSFVKASQTIIKKPSSSTGSRNGSVSTARVHVYVDRGTDAEVLVTDEVTPAVVEIEAVVPFQPLFPLVEDLVIRFAHDSPNDIFEYVIALYRTGSYPTLPFAAEEPANQEVHEDTDREARVRPTSHLTAETDDDGFQRRHEFDPYADNNYPAGVNQWPTKDTTLQIKSEKALQPLTPSTTPPPTARGVPEKFCDFTPMNPNSVIGIQNSLRSLLDLYFPTGENGYTQYMFPVPSELDRLWKPVFRNDTDAPIGNEGRTVDQIIALGCEEGVKLDLFAQVSGQIEKLGMKREGLNKASKIDLRYFIATVMQSQSSLPPGAQSNLNPVPTPEILAACIVPQIESYLATNNSTRLLVLHYPSEHLATVLALRKILGQDVLKVAGILDSLSSDPPSAVSGRPSAAATNPLSNEATLNARSQKTLHQKSIPASNTPSNDQLKKEAVSFSKANHLLPSSASDTEIATFLSGILKGLMEKSIYYTPEPELEPKTIIVEKVLEKVVEKYIEKPSLPPQPASRDSSHPPVSYSASQRRNESKIARLTGEKTPPRTPTNARGHKYAVSVASGRTTGSERFRREETRIEKEWENFYIGEEDSEDDDYDRMILGRRLAKIVPDVPKVYPEGKAPKRSTKKALKWLGLA